MRSFFKWRSSPKPSARSSRVLLAVEALEDRRQPATLVAPDLLSQYDTGASTFDNVTRSSQLRFAGTTTSSAGADIALVIDDAVAGWFHVNHSGGSTFILPVSAPLTGGNHVARYYDSSTQAYSSALPFTVDLTPPDAPPAPALVANDDPAHMVLQIQGAVGERLHLLIAGQDMIAVIGTGSPQNVSVDVTSLSLDPLAAFTACVIAEDTAGNLSAASANLSVTFNLEGPLPPLDLHLDAPSDSGEYDNDGLTNADTLVFSGTAQPGQTVTLYVDGSPWTSQLVDTDGAFQLSAGPLDPGPHQAWVTAANASGYVGPASEPVAVTIDTTLPVPSNVALVPPNVSPNGDGVQDLANFSFDLSETAYVAVYFLDSEDFSLGSIPLGLLDAGEQTFELAVPEFTEGNYSIIVIASDLADNLGDWVEALFTVDLTPPETPTFALADGQDTGFSASDAVTNLTSPQFAGSAEAGATIELREGTTILGTATAAADGSWTIAADLAEGEHALIAIARDLAGNPASSEPVSVSIDTTAPLVDPGSDPIGMEGTPMTLVGQATGAHPGSQGWGLVSSSTGQTVASVSGPSLTFTPSHAGSYVFRHFATDAAGNVGDALLLLAVQDAAPALHVTWPAAVNLGVPFVIQLGFTDPGGDPLDGWVIIWGDGETESLPGTATTASHTYAALGSFTPSVQGTQGTLTLTATGSAVAVELNQIPTLTNATATAPDTPEDAADPAGVTIADLVAGLGVVDTPASPAGLAITSADASHGTWQFTVDGTTWSPLGTVNDSAALLLAADAQTRVRFVSAQNWHGAANLTARAWDQSDGFANGALVNVADAGVSSETGTLAFAVTPVNDAPILSLPTTLTAYRNTDMTIGSAFVIADVDASRIRVTLVIDEGVIVIPSSQGLNFVTGSGTPALTLDGPLDVLNERLAALIYRPTPGYLGAVSISITVNDLGATGAGGARVATGTLAIAVVNRPPLAVVNPVYTMSANTVLFDPAPGLRNAFVDLDGDPLTIVLANPPTIGTAVVEADGSLHYTPPPGFVGDIAFAVQAFDGVDFSVPLWVTIHVTSAYGLRR